jgi:hypothetical protein
MRRLSGVGRDHDAGILSEESVRDQLSAAEELLYVGHREPALVAAGAALEGALRFRAAHVAGPSASAAALVEALMATGALDEEEREAILGTLAERDRLVRGYIPEHADAAHPVRVSAAVAVAVRLLEPVVRESAAASGARRA